MKKVDTANYGVILLSIERLGSTAGALNSVWGYITTIANPEVH